MAKLRPPSWQMVETALSVPYFERCADGQVSHIHPAFLELETVLVDLSKISYAAYRVAAKLRALQKITRVCFLDLSTVESHLAKHHLGGDSDASVRVSVRLLHQLLEDIYVSQYRSDLIDNPGCEPLDCAACAEVLLNLMVLVFDCHATGSVSMLSVKLLLAVLCRGDLRDKYQYIFTQAASKSGVMDRQRLTLVLDILLSITRHLGEKAFGPGYISPSVDNCFGQASYRDGLLLLDFVDWMFDEPQPLVWIPVLHRLTMAETVKHEAKCNICKMFPITGFRYRCLECFNFDLCQFCFWTRRVAKGHQVSHQTREYTLQTTNSQDLADFKKVLRSKFPSRWSAKRHGLQKVRYTPIQPLSPCAKPVEANQGPPTSRLSGARSSRGCDPGELMTRYQAIMAERKKLYLEAKRLKEDEKQRQLFNNPRLPVATSDQRAELERIIRFLEADNQKLESEIHAMRRRSHDRRETASVAKLRPEKADLLARQEALEAHNRQLEMQLQKVRMLLQQIQDHASLARIR